jgi:hypothetical protein
MDDMRRIGQIDVWGRDEKLVCRLCIDDESNLVAILGHSKQTINSTRLRCEIKHANINHALDESQVLGTLAEKAREATTSLRSDLVYARSSLTNRHLALS